MLVDEVRIVDLADGPKVLCSFCGKLYEPGQCIVKGRRETPGPHGEMGYGVCASCEGELLLGKGSG